MSFGFFLRNKSRSTPTSNNRLGFTSLGGIETLEPRVVLDASVVISEFMASNDNSIVDEDGDDSDWIELLNITAETVNLKGWHLTDDPENLDQWRLPEVSLNPGEHLLLFASGKDRDNPEATLHTNFGLGRSGEYLALTRPDQTVEHAYAPGYPQQAEDVSYGIPNGVTEAVLLAEGAAAQVYIPTSAALDPADINSGLIEGSWLDPAFDTNSPGWTDATTGLGFFDASTDPNPAVGDGLKIADSVAEFSNFQTVNGWRYGYWNATADADGVYTNDSREFTTFSWTGLTTISAFNHWDGSKWDIAVDPETPKTEMRSDGAQPSGLNSGDAIHNPIRRWTSEVSGTILISGTIADLDSSGDGVIGRIYQDGQEVLSQPVDGDSHNFELYLTVNQGDEIDFMIDLGPAANDVGDNTEFTIQVEDITSLVGPDGPIPTIATELNSDIADQMRGISPSAYIRIPFDVGTGNYSSLVMEMKYDDGFVAYLNGIPVAARNAPDQVAWTSTATSDRPSTDAIQAESINLSDSIDLLIPGSENVLMIHALNESRDNGDLLISPELFVTDLQVDLDDVRYFINETPGEKNGFGDATLGPVFVNRTHTPDVPRSNEPILVTTQVAETFAAISKVELHYAVMYEDDVIIPMVDDGTSGDTVANDGIYSAMIPGNLANDGEMIRWFMTSEDTNSQIGRLPTFEDPRNTEEYFGTIVQDTSVETNLPLVHWFVESRSRAMGGAGTRGSLYYDGEFYDTVRFDLHGQSSSGFPTIKKSMNVDLPDDHRFQWKEGDPKMKDFNLLTNFADKAKVRNTLGYEQRKAIGDPYHIAEPIRLHLNGEFFAVYDFVEDGEDRWLERLGMDPEGALYKMYNSFNSGTGEKKTRRDENTQDLRDIVAATGLRGDELTNYLFDNVNLPAMVNYLVGFAMTSNRDCCHKNYYAYRDTNGTGEWQFMPWDVDLSQGRNWVGSLAYFDDTITHTNPLFMGSNNNLISDLYALDGFRDMYLRRLRTAMDEYVKPPGTPYEELPLETRVDELVALFEADANLDNELNPARWGQTGFQTFQEATDILKNEYSGPRRDWLYSQVQPEEVDITVLLSGNVGEVPIRYLVPSDNLLGNSWVAANFDDADWSEGTSGIGFEQSSRGGYEDLLATDIGEEMEGRTSAYVRTSFTIDSLENIDELTLRMKYDDGFIAYINGTEVLRQGVDEGASGFDITSRGHADRLAVNYVNFNITHFINTLQVGENVLAVQAVNSSATSNDMLMLPELVEGTISNSSGEIPTAQHTNPPIEFGLIDYNPVSGNQDEEFIQLTNNNSFAVDLTGWQLDGGIDMTFRPGTVLPAGWSIYAVADAKSFRARAEGPSGNQALFVHGNYDGHLSSYGETINLVGKNDEVVSSLTYEGVPSVTQTSLRVSEVMYNPHGPTPDEVAANPLWFAEDFEYLELQNISSTETLDLSGVAFAKGVQFSFTDSQISSLAPSERVLVVRDADAFAFRYGSAAAARVAGEFINATGLSNTSETIKLDDASGSTVQEFQYSDDVDRGWPLLADGQGASLETVDPNGDYSSGANWQASGRIGGTPATASDAFGSSIVINEVHSRTTAPAVDEIELQNSGQQTEAVSHFWISDSASSLQELSAYAIPATSLAAQQFLALNQSDFGFGISGSGERVYLTAGDANGPTHFVDYVDLPALQADRTFGRSPDGTGEFAQLTSATLGQENAAPFVDSVLLTEVHYHPAPPSSAALAIYPELTATDLEFVEVHNSGSSTEDISDWRIRGDISFEFPAGTMLAAGSTITILRFDPSNADNASRLEAFRTEFEISDAESLIGGFGGSLNDAGERVTLQRAEPVAALFNFVLADEVRFQDVAPWPTSADGAGNSLHRISPPAYGDRASSWAGQSPSPGVVEFGTGTAADFNDDGLLNIEDVNLFSDALQSADPDARFDLTGDGVVDAADRDQLIMGEFGTDYGDSNLDGLFNSSDLVLVFAAGEFEDPIAGNSTWEEGDWNMDGDFGTQDLVLAFVAGGFTAAATPLTRDIVLADQSDIGFAKFTNDATVFRRSVTPRKLPLTNHSHDLDPESARLRHLDPPLTNSFADKRWAETRQVIIRGGKAENSHRDAVFATLGDELFERGKRQL